MEEIALEGVVLDQLLSLELQLLSLEVELVEQDFERPFGTVLVVASADLALVVRVLEAGNLDTRNLRKKDYQYP